MIHIYKQEELDGIAQQIKTTARIKYDIPTRTLDTTYKENISLDDVPTLAKSSIRDTWDLYPFGSVLVSAGGCDFGWNDNDDVFDSGEAWAAKNSPVNKQLNYMHNEKTIIGHMTASLVVDTSGNIIEDEETIPEFYDIVVASVLYRKWSDDGLQEIVDNIIEGIPEDKWFVSMECLFSNFDYAIITPDDEYMVLPRNSSTAYLTKHLRAYGGSGVFQDRRIGRLIRNLTFSGIAIVDNPANPRSIVLNNKNNLYSIAKSNIPTKEKTNMADNSEILVQQLKDELAKANAKHDKLQEKFDSMVVEAQEKERDRLQSQIASLKVDVEDLEKDVDAKKETLASKDTEISTLTKDLKDALAKLEEAESKLQKAEKDSAKANRVAKLVDAGVSHAEAESLVEKFLNLDDNQFDEIVNLKAMTKDKAEDDKSKDKDKKKDLEKEKATMDKDKTKAETDALDDAEPDDKSVAFDNNPDNEDSDAELASAGLAWFADIRNQSK